jgi:hypothetical protein
LPSPNRGGRREPSADLNAADDADAARDRVLVQLAHANGNLTEAEKRRRTELLARLRKEHER